MLRKEYWKKWKAHYELHAKVVKLKASYLEADGCSGVPEFYRMACLEHDIAYRTHVGYIDNQIINKEEADLRFKWHTQMLSPFGRFSPMAQWRYWGVYFLADKAWEGEKDEG